MLIKVCGITNLRDAQAAVRLGANALGFIRHPRSPRFVSYEVIEAVAERIPRGVLKVGAFVKGWLEDLREELFDAIQLHGFADESELPRLSKRMLVAVSVESAAAFPRHEIIIDESMGEGVVSDWSALRDIGRDYVLAGGLRPSNIRQALSELQPAGIDVCSGVEAAPGIKDLDLLKRFLDAAVDFSVAGGRHES